MKDNFIIKNFIGSYNIQSQNAIIFRRRDIFLIKNLKNKKAELH